MFCFIQGSSVSILRLPMSMTQSGYTGPDTGAAAYRGPADGGHIESYGKLQLPFKTFSEERNTHRKIWLLRIHARAVYRNLEMDVHFIMHGEPKSYSKFLWSAPETILKHACFWISFCHLHLLKFSTIQSSSVLLQIKKSTSAAHPLLKNQIVRPDDTDK